MALPKVTTLKIYGDTLLDDIITRVDMNPKPNGTWMATGYTWPDSEHPFTFEDYLSHLPPEKLNIDTAVTDKLVRPIDTAYMCLDPDIEKAIYLVVAHREGGKLAARDRHWAIRWTVFSRGEAPFQALRNLEILSNEAVTDEPRYLINYGPRTSADCVESKTGMLVIELGKLTLVQRRMLEAIAWNIGVVQPDGVFNCQNWIAAVLSVAVARGLFKADSIRVALEKALKEDVKENEYVKAMPRGF